jgi:hypothetical protein
VTIWGTLTAVFALACVAAPIVTEVVRSVVHRRREQRDGLGGTQDIAMWGTLVGFFLFASTVVCGIAWVVTR